jgi:hypothetical protein
MCEPSCVDPQVLLKHKIVTEDTAAKVRAFITSNQTKDPNAAPVEAATSVPSKPAPAKR